MFNYLKDFQSEILKLNYSPCVYMYILNLLLVLQKHL